jgi:hypothetical protein
MIGKRERALLLIIKTLLLEFEKNKYLLKAKAILLKTTRSETSTEEVLFVFICDIKLSCNQWEFYGRLSVI